MLLEVILIMASPYFCLMQTMRCLAKRFFKWFLGNQPELKDEANKIGALERHIAKKWKEPLHMLCKVR